MAILILILLLSARAVTSRAFTNLGYLQLVSSLRSPATTAGDANTLASGEDRLSAAKRLLDIANRLAPTDAIANYAASRAALALGEYEVAIPRLAQARSVLTHNPFVLRDLIYAYGLSGNVEQIIELSAPDASPLPQSSITDDTVAWAYLTRNGAGDLARAAALRPADLFTNYQLLKQAESRGDSTLAATYRDRLQHFPAAALMPEDERLLDTIVMTLPRLYADGVWDQFLFGQALSYLVWRYPQRADVTTLLAELQRAEPDEALWSELLHELDQRRDTATDAMGEAHLLPGQEPQDIRDRAASALDIPAESVTLQDNLIRNGEFKAADAGDVPEWYWTEAVSRSLWADATFMGGVDDFPTEHVRIQGLWTQQPDKGEETARAGYWQKTNMRPGVYWLEFSYRGDVIDVSRPSVWLGFDAKMIDEFFLPVSDTAWHHAGMLLRVQRIGQLTTLLRNWGAGSVGIADVSLHRVIAPTDADLSVDRAYLFLDGTALAEP